MRPALAGWKGAGAGLCIGGATALLHLFAFPAGSVTTLMHAVLNLPGPGAGIALVMGPFLVVAMLLASGAVSGAGAALAASLAFGIVDAVGSTVLGIGGNPTPANPGGAAGNLLFISGIVLSGVAAEAVLAASGRLRRAWRNVAAGAGANMVLLVYFWTAVFPRTKGWVKLSDVPILMGLCLCAAVVAGLAGHFASEAIGRTTGARKEGS